MKEKHPKVKTSILAKIALSKLERDVKTCWEHLEKIDSLQTKDSLELAVKIIKDIENKASGMSEVIKTSEEWERLIEAQTPQETSKRR